MSVNYHIIPKTMEEWWGGGLANLSINDVCDVTGGQQRHPDKLKHVRQVGLALLSVVFDPV